MKFVYLANVRMPTEKAHGIQIMKTCEALAGQGVEVELLVPKRHNFIKEDPFVFYKLPTTFSITRLWCWDLVSANFFGALGFWLESWTFFRSLKNYLQLRGGAVFYTRDLALAYWLSEVSSDIYYEIHNLPEKTDARHQAVWNRAKGLVVISNGLKKELVRRGVPQEKILVAHDAVDLKEFTVPESKEDCRKKLHLPLDKKIVVYTGHLYEWKGARVLTEAARTLPTSVAVYLVGGTELDILKFRTEYQQVSQLHFIGWQEHSQMVYWQKVADVLILPTSSKNVVGEKYTSPLKLFEYLASGTPIIASDSAAIREILNEKNSILVKPDSPDALQRAIKELLQNPTKYASLGVKGHQDSLNYSWGKRAQLIVSFVS